MAQEGDFVGNTLRVSAFLRIAQHLPERPRRCRRDVPAAAKAVNHHVVPPAPVPASDDDARAPSPSLGGDVLPIPEDEEEVQGNSTPPKRKSPLVYASKAPKADLRQREPASTTRKRRLPVNELALVRTTTDGLPDRVGGSCFLEYMSFLNLMIAFHRLKIPDQP